MRAPAGEKCDLRKLSPQKRPASRQIAALWNLIISVGSFLQVSSTAAFRSWLATLKCSWSCSAYEKLGARRQKQVSDVRGR